MKFAAVYAIGSLVILLLGIALGACLPYLFNLIAMMLRHCGGM